MQICLFHFSTSLSTTRLYRGRAPRQERLTILRAATHETELGDHDFCLSRSHYTDTDPTCRERAAIAGIEPGTSSPGVARSTAELPRPPFNAKVGQRGDEHSVGMHGTGNRNKRGERLVEWCEMNNFTIGNTCFQQPQRRKWTWKSPGDSTRNQIDYILISGRFKNALLSQQKVILEQTVTQTMPWCKQNLD